MTVTRGKTIPYVDDTITKKVLSRDVPDVKFARFRKLPDVVCRIPEPEFGKIERLRGPIFSPNKLICQ